ncbi:MAG: DUF2505 domain-containing protein [Actinomycetaceae bacterium]|nr:DUF2505 domain-containing protein [Actinomycetaceae bacterium]
MEFRTQATYPAPFDEVLKMLTSEDFQRQRLAGLPVTIKSIKVEDGPAADQVTVITQIHAKPADLQLPNMVDRFIPRAGITVTMSDTWNTKTGDGILVFNTGNLPVKLAATSKLVDEGGSVTRTLDGMVTVRVPLMGGKLEKQAVQELDKIVRAEEAAAHKYLKG